MISSSRCAASPSDRSLSQKGEVRGMMPLGHRLTWRRKPRGTTACRESGERPKTCRARPCKTRVIWRKLDCLTPQSPGMQKNILRHHVWERSCRIRAVVVKLSESPSGGRWPVRSLKGTNGAPTSRSIRRSVREGGIAYGARALWRRSPRSSPGTGKPSAWRRGAGGSTTQRARYA